MNETVQVYTDVFGDSVVLTPSVRAAILSKHPEAIDFIDQIRSVLSTPDEVRRSSTDPRVALYYQYAAEVLGGKWVVVVVKHADRKFVSTVYATSKIKSGDALWTK